MERPNLFRSEIARQEEGFSYLSGRYRETIRQCSVLPEDGDDMRTARIATCLSVQYFMESLLERKDRMSMWSGVEVRVPFADHRILEYVYNVPWTVNTKTAWKRRCCETPWRLSPGENPAPQEESLSEEHNPEYEQIVGRMLQERSRRKTVFRARCLTGRRSGRLWRRKTSTWFGQLMARAQLIAWLVQLDIWLEAYHVELV